MQTIATADFFSRMADPYRLRCPNEHALGKVESCETHWRCDTCNEKFAHLLDMKTKELIRHNH